MSGVQKTFYIYDHWLMPTPYNHRFFVEKYAQGFVGHGFEVKLIKSMYEIQNPGVIMVSSHNILHGYDRGETSKITKTITGGLLRLSAKISIGGRNPFAWIMQFATTLKNIHLSLFLQYIQDKDLIVTTWFTHQQEHIFLKHKAKVIYSGDHYYIDPSTSGKKRYDFYTTHTNALPVKFSASIEPEMEKEILGRDKHIDVGFVGSRQYKKEWYEYFKGQKNTEIYGTPPYISEDKRVDIYKHSKIILGFHSDENIKNGNVTERVFEAMAYGAVCVTDNPAARIATNDSVIVVETKEALIHEVHKLLSDKIYYQEYVRKGISFAYKTGLYYHRAGELLQLANSLYGIRF